MSIVRSLETRELPRLPFIDGVRGLAAFIVLTGHLIFTVPAMSQPPQSRAGWGDWLAWPFRFGSEMVLLFLMVSGFSLYYSERVRQLRGHPTRYREFLARRAWRIGPVYYFAVALGLIVYPLTQGLVLRPASKSAGHQTWGGVLAHFGLVQNLNPSWLYQVNGPLWSIAFEIQLYLIFPVIFGAMQRWNPLSVAVAVVIGVKVISLLDLGFPIFGLARWFVTGALLAEASARGFRLPLWLTLPIGSAALVVGMAQLPQLSSELRHDAVWLVAFVFLILAMLEGPASRKNPLTWSALRWLGLRSYSIYALHWPLVLLLLLVAQALGLHGGWAALAVSAAGIPLVLGMAVVAFKWVEAPSLQKVAQVGRPRVPQPRVLTKAPSQPTSMP